MSKLPNYEAAIADLKSWFGVGNDSKAQAAAMAVYSSLIEDQDLPDDDKQRLTQRITDLIKSGSAESIHAMHQVGRSVVPGVEVEKFMTGEHEKAAKATRLLNTYPNHGGDSLLSNPARTATPDPLFRGPGVRSLANGDMTNLLKGTPLDRPGVYAGTDALKHLERVASKADADRDLTLSRIKDFAFSTGSSRTYFEKFIEICGSERRFMMGLAERQIWVLSEECHTTHDRVIAGRPKMIEAAHPFFISGKMIDRLEEISDAHDGRAVAPGHEKVVQIDQPFKTIWLERTDGGPLFYLARSDGPAWIIGTLVHEETANSYFCETLIASKQDATGAIVFMINTMKLMPETVFGRLKSPSGALMPMFNPGTMVQTATHDVLYWTFKAFRRDCAFANEKIKAIRARVGSGKDRTAVKINRVVRVMLKGECKEYQRAAGRKIVWSHKWEVMGHWRVTAGLGKDRDGNYTVRGMTWVTPHTKGKGALVKKTRVVVDSASENGKD